VSECECEISGEEVSDKLHGIQVVLTALCRLEVGIDMIPKPEL